MEWRTRLYFNKDEETVVDWNQTFCGQNDLQEIRVVTITIYDNIHALGHTMLNPHPNTLKRGKLRKKYTKEPHE